MDKIQKFLIKLAKKDRQMLTRILNDIRALKLEKYTVKALKGYKRLFRIRKGKIRIVFTKINGYGVILSVSYRKDAYKE